MKKIYTLFFLTFFFIIVGAMTSLAQTVFKGKVIDGETGEDLIGAAVSLLSGGTGGGITNYEGEFAVKIDNFPAKIKISYTGYESQEIVLNDAAQKVTVKLSTGSLVLEETVVRGQRIDDKQKAKPLTVEKLDAIAIKETPAVSFYNGLGNLKGVDMTTASLGFTVINTRGFNSTSPVRSLQIIDGVDNQAPGLNFSLGNFLGSSDLDVNSVDLIVGASSSFYGPNAFNGVISMETKNPFLNKGLAVSLKGGERELFEGAVRYADAFKNKAGKEFMAFKINFFGLRAYDWVADNYDPITGSEGNNVFGVKNNPGRYNAVNIYGDEPFSGNDFRNSFGDQRTGLNTYFRTGYKETDLVDYNTHNIKTGAALHFRLNPSKEYESPELILASNYGTGTTVYQGDNRFRLKGIRFLQNRIELRKRDKYFIRFYSTNEDAGRSYDPYFTALRLQEASKSNTNWSNDYQFWWVRNDLGAVYNKMKSMGYPFEPLEDQIRWQQQNADFLTQMHSAAADYANKGRQINRTIDFFAPNTARFDSLFSEITSRNNNKGGTRFYDKSALYHAHGEYHFKPSFLKDLVVGGNVRLYRPVSGGTIFSDSLQAIKNSEFGVYAGAEKEVGKFKFSATMRVDKNQNFDYLGTPSASIVWTPGKDNYLRLSFASAIRNPTLSDQYLNLRVGPATLVGNLNGFDSLVTLESFNNYRNKPNPNVGDLRYINIPEIRPEKVKTFELGYRTTLFDRLYVDAGYYFNIYNDFIGYNIGLTVPLQRFEFAPGQYTYFPQFNQLAVWRVASNASQQVTTQGFAIGLNYYFKDYYMVQGNYSWNKLNTAETDPIVPAFNTPEHKYNISFSARDIPFASSRKTTWGFMVNYKWIEGFLFEGSPQFTGNIPSYNLLDAQVSMHLGRMNSTIKIGAANLLNNKQFQVYGGPRIGRMAYIACLYDFRKK